MANLKRILKPGNRQYCDLYLQLIRILRQGGRS
jgi:hypothetical protein